MTLLYVRSTTGSDSNDGLGWATAKATLEGARAIAAAGDTIYVSQAHSQAFGTSTYDFASPGTLANPVKIIGVDDGNEPPIAYASSPPQFTATTGSISFTGNVEYENLYISSGSGASTNSTIPGQITNSSMGVVRIRKSVLRNASSAGRPIAFGAASTGYAIVVKLDECELYLGSAAGGTQVIGLNKGRLEMTNCWLGSGMNTPAALFSMGSAQYGTTELYASGFDCSNMASTLALLRGGNGINTLAFFRDSKFPSGWGETIFSSTVPVGSSVELYNCTAGSSVIRYLKQDNAGKIRSEETIVRAGGSTENGTAYSLKFSASSSASAVNTLHSREIPPVYVEASGTQKTATVEILTDSTTDLTNADIWLEGVYLANSGDTLAKEVTGRKPNLTSASTLASSSETWTTTGLTNPQKRKLQVSFTQAKTGYVHFRVAMAKASSVIYVDPKISVA